MPRKETGTNERGKKNKINKEEGKKKQKKDRCVFGSGRCDENRGGRFCGASRGATHRWR